MAASRDRDGDGIEVAFVFVRRGDPRPVEWMARHPGWVSFPATLVTRPTPRPRSPQRGPGHEPGTGPGEALGFGPGSRPASQDAPPVRRRRVPVHRLPNGAGGCDAADAVAASLRASEAMEAAGSTFAIDWIGSSDAVSAAATSGSIAVSRIGVQATIVPSEQENSLRGSFDVEDAFRADCETPDVNSLSFPGASDNNISYQEAQNETCQQYISANCKGSILREFPGQFLDVPLEEVFRLAKRGNGEAQSARKLLTDGRFKK